MKTKEELDSIKEEISCLSKKLAELSEEELSQVAGGQAVLPLLSLAPPDVTLNDGMDKSELVPLPY